ncbi:helix-turn-helix domain-containing protein [Geodermatophilus sp. SYSU D00804]
MTGRQDKSGDEGLARLIRGRREALGLSRRDLADRTGLSYPYISQLETGYRLPSPKVMHLLARTLGMPASDLFQALPGDTGQDAAVDAPAAAPGAPESRWIGNPDYREPAPQPRPGTPEEAARAAISALEVLPPDRRLEALATVQAAVLAGVVRDQAIGTPPA